MDTPFRVFVDGGPMQSPDSLAETAQLGTLGPGAYAYSVTQNGLENSWCFGTDTVTGTFCIQDSGCHEDACQCLVFVPAYAVIGVGTLGGSSSWAHGINNTGQFVGVAGYLSGPYQGFLMTPSTAQSPSIPTLSEWSQVVMTLLLLVAGTLVWRRNAA